MNGGGHNTRSPLEYWGPRMRLTTEQIDVIRRAVTELAGPRAQVRVFGSRLDDSARGGDLDLLVELSEPVANPAMLSAQIAARVGRALHHRTVDVLLLAPNLKQLPIHEVALREGQRL